MLLFHSISCFRVITFLAGGLFFHVPIHRPTICHTSIPFLCLSTQPPILLYCTSVNCSSFRNCEICISLLRKMFWCSVALVRFCAAGSCAACCSGERTDPSGAGRKAASCTVTLDLFYAFVNIALHLTQGTWGSPEQACRPNFGGLVLDRIDAEFCNQNLFLKSLFEI